MKYLLILLCAVVLACNNPEFSPEKPFIVNHVECYGDGTATYRTKLQHYIEAPCGLYTVGDTIKLDRQ